MSAARPPLVAPLVALSKARVREFLREPEAIFWVFIFPVLLAVVLGVAFREGAPEPLPVGVEAGPAAAARQTALAASGRLAPRELPADQARRALATGKLARVVREGEPPAYWFDPTRPESRAARLEVDAALQAAAGRRDPFVPREEILADRGARYIDFLGPGLLGMNLMGTGMWAVGFALVSARAGKLLKLFVAAPTRRWQLLAAQIVARSVFLALEVAVLVVFSVTVLDVPFRGSLALFAAICVLGAFAFVGLGLLTASRAKTIEGVSGLMNFVMFPMWIGTGVFFSTERFPDAVQPFVQALPLTALNDALRAVMLDGAGLAATAPELALLALWGAATFALAVRLFRWV